MRMFGKWPLFYAQRDYINYNCRTYNLYMTINNMGFKLPPGGPKKNKIKGLWFATNQFFQLINLTLLSAVSPSV